MRRLFPSLTGSCRGPLRVALLAMLVTAVPLMAQDNQAGSAYAVRGQVINKVSGQAVPQAQVALNSDFVMLTDGDGQFSFDNVPQGTYMVSVRKPGFVGFGNGPGGTVRSGRSTPEQTGPPRRIRVGMNMPSLLFQMQPEASIAGQITLSTADSPAGIHVTLYHRRMQSGHTRWITAGNTTTRSDGTFFFGGLPSGSYMLSTEASMDNPDASANNRLPVWGYPPVYYPGVTDPGAAGVLLLAPGQQAEADFTLTRQQFFPVTAAVHRSESGMASFNVLDSGGLPTGFEVQYDPQTQLVHARVPSGSWSLDGNGFGRSMEWGRADFQVAGAPVSLAINIVSVPHIPILIQRDFSSTNVQLDNSNPGLGLILTSTDQSGRGAGGLDRVPGTSGTAWETVVPEPGRYWVEATPYPPAYVASITSGGVNLASSPLIIVPGSSPAPIEVTLRDDPGSISGQVSHDPGASSTSSALGEDSQIWIYAIPLFPIATPLPTGFVQADGTFTISHLAPGAYRVVACDAPQDFDFHSPEGLGAWTGKGETVTVEAGATANASLTVIHVESAP